MKSVFFLLLISVAAEAGVYKCIKDNASVYQDRPCDVSAKQMTIEVDDPFLGCFEAQVPYNAVGGGLTTKLQVRRIQGKYSFATFNPNPMPSAIVTVNRVNRYNRYNQNTTIQQTVYWQGGTILRVAGSEELRVQSDNLHYAINKGVSTGLPWNATATTKRPIGLYAAKGKDGRNIMVASLANGFGAAEKIQCPVN